MVVIKFIWATKQLERVPVTEDKKEPAYNMGRPKYENITIRCKNHVNKTALVQVCEFSLGFSRCLDIHVYRTEPWLNDQHSLYGSRNHRQ